MFSRFKYVIKKITNRYLIIVSCTIFVMITYGNLAMAKRSTAIRTKKQVIGIYMEERRGVKRA